MKPIDEALVIMAELISLGLIMELGEGEWSLTKEGNMEANKAMDKLTPREKALVLLLSQLLIKRGG